MAIIPLTSLTPGSSVVAVDVLVFVDTSDTTQSPSGTTKQVSAADLRTSLFAGGGAYAADPLTAGSIVSAGQVDIVAADLRVTRTSQQASFRYNATNRLDVTVSSVGAVSLAAVSATAANAFTLNSPVAITGALAIAGALTGVTTVNTSGAATIGGTINGVSITAGAISGLTTVDASGKVTLTATGTSIAASGAVSVASGKELGLNAAFSTSIKSDGTNVVVKVGSGDRFGIGPNGETIIGSNLAGESNIRTNNLSIQNGTAPAGNPSSGGFLWVESGALKYRGSSGTVSTIAPA